MNDLKLEVGKSYDCEDGQVIELVYEIKIITTKYRFLGVMEDLSSRNFHCNYYDFKGKDSNDDQAHKDRKSVV